MVLPITVISCEKVLTLSPTDKIAALIKEFLMIHSKLQLGGEVSSSSANVRDLCVITDPEHYWSLQYSIGAKQNLQLIFSMLCGINLLDVTESPSLSTT